MWLKVRGKRADGFHELETLFCEIDLADTIIWYPGPGELKLTVTGAELGDAKDNLVIRAAELFAAATGKRPCGSFHLEKSIPAGGGLGGGSSDAAGALHVFNKHFDAPLEYAELAKLAAELGSDVPFFLLGGCCVGRGRGEILEVTLPPEDLASGWLLIPHIHISTAAVFGALGPIDPSNRGPVAIGENDLLEPALAVSVEFRAVWRLLNIMLADMGELFMTGSGSTLVWLYDVEELPIWTIALFEKFQITVVPFRLES